MDLARAWFRVPPVVRPAEIAPPPEPLSPEPVPAEPLTLEPVPPATAAEPQPILTVGATPAVQSPIPEIAISEITVNTMVPDSADPHPTAEPTETASGEPESSIETPSPEEPSLEQPISEEVSATADISPAEESEDASAVAEGVAGPDESVPTEVHETAPEPIVERAPAEAALESAQPAPVATDETAPEPIVESAPAEAALEPAQPAPAATPEELTRMSATEIARRVRAREVSPVAVVEAHLAAIERTNPTMNAVVTLAADHALEAARKLEADLAAGRPVGPLAGVPVGIKDLTATAGIRTTYGATLYADNVPSEDALVVQRLKAAGAIVIGKTNTSEFGAGAHTFNAVFGATRNPWNPALSASGSTGGGAAGLRSGMFAIAEGTDFGGSLRTPAAFCGVVGIRPSPGLVPRYPNITPWDILSVAGPMARSVADLALALQAMAGPSPYSPLMVPMEGRDFVAAANASIKPGLRVAYCPDPAKIGVDHELERICREAAFQLQDAGASVEETDLDLSIGRSAFIQLRAQAQLSRHLHHLGKLDKLGANIAGNIRLGLSQSPRDLALGEHGQAQIFHAFRRFFERYDVLLTPCTAVGPFPVEQNHPETINGQPLKTYIDWVAHTFVVTLAGLPAISVPCGMTAGNLPVGLQVVGPRWGEELALTVAKAVEDSHPVGWPSL